MQIEETAIPGAVILTPKRFGDHRGFFSEVWNHQLLADHGIDVDFVQDNHSLSQAKGTIRGLHYQAPPHGQAKLVRCGGGSVWDVAVDVRKGSPAFGQWIGVELSFENGRQLFVPEGCLHGFITLTQDAQLLYKCSDFYAPSADGAVRWDSAGLGIDWPLDGTPQLSDKDAAAPDFAEWESPFEWSAP
ncbi:MAG: dTDP-4-dehydrorhamnose 3,5-epimerase [Pseudomonadota bacterium]